MKNGMENKIKNEINTDNKDNIEINEEVKYE